jgi:putative transposase
MESLMACGRRLTIRQGKGKSSHKLLSEYQALRKRYWGQHLWARGYWVASSGNVTDEIWKQYIEDQKPEEPDDNFKVV